MWKTAYLQGAGLAACDHWPLVIANNLQTQLSVSPAVWKKITKKKN